MTHSGEVQSSETLRMRSSRILNWSGFYVSLLQVELNIYNALIKSSLLYGSETWRLTENNKRRVEATEMDALRISRKDRIRNVTIRQQIGLEETIIKEIEQNQLTWYGHAQRMAEGRLPRIALKWIPKQRTVRGRPKKNWMEGIKKAMRERNVNEGQGEIGSNGI